MVFNAFWGSIFFSFCWSRSTQASHKISAVSANPKGGFGYSQLFKTWFCPGVWQVYKLLSKSLEVKGLVQPGMGFATKDNTIGWMLKSIPAFSFPKKNQSLQWISSKSEELPLGQQSPYKYAFSVSWELSLAFHHLMPEPLADARDGGMQEKALRTFSWPLADARGKGEHFRAGNRLLATEKCMWSAWHSDEGLWKKHIHSAMRSGRHCLRWTQSI